MEVVLGCPLSQDELRPNNALRARTELLTIRIHEEGDDDQKLNSIISEISECLERSVGLSIYPALKIVDRFSRLGRYLGHVPAYESLFEKMREISRTRSGQVTEGNLLLERGMDLLLDGHPAKALEILGQARHRLYKRETLEDAARASLCCSVAYTAMGLYWAARMEAVTGAHISVQLDYGEFVAPRECFWAITRIARFDLSQGRIGAFLAWFELAANLRNLLASKHYSTAKFDRELADLDALLALLFAKCDVAFVPSLRNVADTLDRLGLYGAYWSLIHRDWKPGDPQLDIDEGKSDPEIQEYLDLMRGYKLDVDLAEPSGVSGEAYCIFSAKIMGVEYRITAQNRFGPLSLAENLLGILEASLALARWENIAFIVDRFEVTIEEGVDGETPPKLNFGSGANARGYKLRWKPGLLNWLERGPRAEVSEFLHTFLFSVLIYTTIDPMTDLEAEFDHWRKQETFMRALGVSPVTNMIIDLIGRNKYDIGNWTNDAVAS